MLQKENNIELFCFDPVSLIPHQHLRNCNRAIGRLCKSCNTIVQTCEHAWIIRIQFWHTWFEVSHTNRLCMHLEVISFYELVCGNIIICLL